VPLAIDLSISCCRVILAVFFFLVAVACSVVAVVVVVGGVVVVAGAATVGDAAGAGAGAAPAPVSGVAAGGVFCACNAPAGIHSKSPATAAMREYFCI
jgi:hypothetical protein